MFFKKKKPEVKAEVKAERTVESIICSLAEEHWKRVQKSPFEINFWSFRAVLEEVGKLSKTVTLSASSYVYTTPVVFVLVESDSDRFEFQLEGKSNRVVVLMQNLIESDVLKRKKDLSIQNKTVMDKALEILGK